MNSTISGGVVTGGITGGLCGTTACDGGLIDVGLWEGVEGSLVSGLARNNTRISGGAVTGYRTCPTSCSTDSDCPDTTSLVRRCKAMTPGGAKVCVQDHLSWVAASVGMNGSYSNNATIPGGADTFPNGTGPFASMGAWKVDFRLGNNSGVQGLDYLIAPPVATLPCEIANAPPTPYINRSQDQTPNVTNWPGRAFGTFVTAASGNDETSTVSCATVKNGLCVGMYSYEVFNDLPTHHRTHLGSVGSSFVNSTSDLSLERPHLLGPGHHSGLQSGLHMPAIDVSAPASTMRHASYSSGAILGTSFSSPAILGLAIQAHQSKGFFSGLAYPMVNKAVLLASTRDVNNDGPIGKSTSWSGNAPTLDAEDGAGQVNIVALQNSLANNRYGYADLSNSDFVSCGSTCRRYVMANVTIPASTKMRVAMAWQACMIAEGDVPVINNDLDLAVICGNPTTQCGLNFFSAQAMTSELEMVERPSCSFAWTCSIEVRIKNGVVLNPCGSTTTERVGVAWSFSN
jgi:hypothetical protein